MSDDRPAPGVAREMIRSAALKVADQCDEWDRQLHEGREDVSCQRGCSHCCYLYIDSTWSEAVDILTYVRKNKRPAYWKRVMMRAQQAQEKMRGVGSTEEYLAARIPCMFLDADGSCGVYDHRPVQCRLHWVVSDPDICAGPDLSKIRKIDTKDQNLYFAGRYMSMEEEDFGVVIQNEHRPLPVMVLLAAAFVEKGVYPDG